VRRIERSVPTGQQIYYDLLKIALTATEKVVDSLIHSLHGVEFVFITHLIRLAVEALHVVTSLIGFITPNTTESIRGFC